MRPIIAICNDVYAPSLRSLRPLSEVVSYRRVSPAIIADRLRSICAAEDIKVDPRMLTDIANETESDMRSCLNILQFGVNPIALPSSLASSRPDDATKPAKQEISKKDREKSWTSVVNRIFRRHRGFSNKSDESAAVLADIHSCGDYDRIMSSCFTMYPEMQYYDDMLQKPVRFGDWLYFHDMVNRGIYTLQHGALAEYHGYAPLACYSLFSSSRNVAQNGKDVIVSTGLEYRETQRMNEQLRDEFIQYTSATSRQAFNKSEVSSELVPYLLKLLNPTLESLSAGGARVSKKNDGKLVSTVNILVDYNISLQLREVETGGNVYHLHPPIETLAQFGEKDQLEASVGKYSTRHALFNELVKVQHLTRVAGGHWTVKKLKSSDPEAQEILNRGKQDTSGKRKLDHSAEDSKTSKAAKTASTFDPFQSFKITIKKVSDANRDESVAQKIMSIPVPEASKKVWVQFHEGVSNAVRRDLAWKDIWI